MEIKDIKPNQGNIDVVVHVIEKEEPRTFEKFGKTGRVCNAKVKDDSGEIKLTLWNEDIDAVDVGDKIHLQNGWCSEFRDEKQLSSGKFGKIEVVEKAVKKTVEKTVGKAPTFVTNDPNILQGGMLQGQEMSEQEMPEELFDDEELVE